MSYKFFCTGCDYECEIKMNEDDKPHNCPIYDYMDADWHKEGEF